MSPVNPEREYVSLMFRASNCYASWDPQRPVRLGDYGHLQKDHSFVVEGNIFDEGYDQEFGITVASNDVSENRCIASLRTTEVKASVSERVGHPVIATAGLKKTFTISSGWGAILIMLNARHQCLYKGGHVEDLIYSTAFSDKNVLVSELYTCQSYARLLVPQQKHAVEVGLDVATHGGLARGNVDLEWKTSAEGGDFKYAYHAEREDGACIQPLFRLVGRRMRGPLASFTRRPVTEIPRRKWIRVLRRHMGPTMELSDFEGDDEDSDSASTLAGDGEDDKRFAEGSDFATASKMDVGDIDLFWQGASSKYQYRLQHFDVLHHVHLLDLCRRLQAGAQKVALVHLEEYDVSDIRLTMTILHPNPEHEYVSLIHGASNYYASWDPLRPVKVGDYGRLQHDYSFSIEGNIFDIDDLASNFDFKPIQSCEDDIRWIEAEKHEAVGVHVGVKLPEGPASGQVKKSATLKSGHGAILGIWKPQKYNLDHVGQIQALLYSEDAWKHRVLVSEVYACHSFARVLVQHKKYEVDITLECTTAPGAQGHAKCQWSTNTTSGDFWNWSSNDDAPETLAYPLFKLVGRKHWFDHLLPVHAHRPVTELEHHSGKGPHLHLEHMRKFLHCGAEQFTEDLEMLELSEKLDTAANMPALELKTNVALADPSKFLLEFTNTSLWNLNPTSDAEFSKAFFEFFAEQLGVPGDRGYM
ncbi:hypothetical protein IEO21_06096 [Rhodonia placenta]|uniref:Uncharacterized protein n=1 Tax=Rhodonia placenta TaxID=104341 RepID=A0A8H7P0Z2_9APHY|nr:hypothetical protein IEO21_06096 [Postia placenta]